VSMSSRKSCSNQRIQALTVALVKIPRAEKCRWASFINLWDGEGGKTVVIRGKAC